MKSLDYYLSETRSAREARIRQQKLDRGNFIRDTMELVYSEDLDEMHAELTRLHAIVGDERTHELLERLFGDRTDGGFHQVKHRATPS